MCKNDRVGDILLGRSPHHGCPAPLTTAALSCDDRIQEWSNNAHQLRHISRTLTQLQRSSTVSWVYVLCIWCCGRSRHGHGVAWWRQIAFLYCRTKRLCLRRILTAVPRIRTPYSHLSPLPPHESERHTAVQAPSPVSLA